MADFVEGFVALVRSDVGQLNLAKYAKKGDIKSAKKVMQKNGVKITDKDERGLTPLHIAMMNNQLKFAAWLLDEEKADIDCTENENLYTPLHMMIKAENWDNIVWLIKRGANWEAQGARAGETPMDLVEKYGSNRITLKFKDLCAEMKGRRAVDKREAARPKAVATKKYTSTNLPPPQSTSTSSSTASTAAPAAGGGGRAGDSFTSDSVALVRAIKKYKMTCDSGNVAAAQSESANILALFQSYQPLLNQKCAGVPPQMTNLVTESKTVLAKGVPAYCNVGRALAARPDNATAAGKFAQVSQLLDKHFKRLIDIIVKKNYNVQ